MLSYQPLQLGPMQQSGSALLRAIQNESMVPLDLLVRESVQNSLDAGVSTRSVDVSFEIRRHETAAIAGLLTGDGVREALLKKHPNGGRLLEIRDGPSNDGLSGPDGIEAIRMGGKRGNLVKLVYEVGRTQDRESAGGSWGLGKTVYFRLGVGLVFYYSRFRREDGVLAERLAACLVEDENSAHRLQKQSQTGIAWWGRNESGYRPIEDASAIHQVLKSLGARAYAGTETGTTIIVPFLRNDLGPRPLDTFDLDEFERLDVAPPWWHADEGKYITVALQRWYGVRIDNDTFAGGPPLHATVNGTRLSRDAMLPVFRLAQELYGVASGTLAIDAGWMVKNGLSVHDVQLNNVFEGGSVAGRVAIARQSPHQLRMTAPNNLPSPYVSLYGQNREPPFPPVVGFMRSPGMIIRWDVDEGGAGWSSGHRGLPDEYLLALFVPRKQARLNQTTLAKLKPPLRGDGSLEAYLRRCELADHCKWADLNGLTIVRRIRGYVGRAIGEQGRTREAPAADAALRASRLLADRLLPKGGFGGDARHDEQDPVGVTRDETPHARGPRGRFEIVSMKYEASRIVVDWRLEWGSKPCAWVVHLRVDAEEGAIDRSTWKDSGLGDFPIRFKDFVVDPSPEASTASIVWKLIEAQSAISIKPAKGAPNGVTSGTVSVLVTAPEGTTLRPVLRADMTGTTDTAEAE